MRNFVYSEHPSFNGFMQFWCNSMPWILLRIITWYPGLDTQRSRMIRWIAFWGLFFVFVLFCFFFFFLQSVTFLLNLETILSNLWSKFIILRPKYTINILSSLSVDSFYIATQLNTVFQNLVVSPFKHKWISHRKESVPQLTKRGQTGRVYLQQTKE